MSDADLLANADALGAFSTKEAYHEVVKELAQRYRDTIAVSPHGADWCIVDADDGIVDRYFTREAALADLTPGSITTGCRVLWVKDPGLI
jgi:hypothetical protein